MRESNSSADKGLRRCPFPRIDRLPQQGAGLRDNRALRHGSRGEVVELGRAQHGVRDARAHL